MTLVRRTIFRKMRLLVVDSDLSHRRAMLETLASEADAGELEFFTADTVDQAMAIYRERHPDLLLISTRELDQVGLELAMRVRAAEGTRHTGIVFVDHRPKDDGTLSVECLEMGADDFLLKPFSGRELVARVEALLRRPRVEVVEREARVFGDLELDPVTRIVRISGEVIDLTRIEFDLLLTFTADPGAVFTRQRLLDLVWGPGWFGDDHVVDVHVANLRKIARADFGLVLAGGQGPLASKLFRFGHLGWVHEADIQSGLDALQGALKAVGYKA